MGSILLSLNVSAARRPAKQGYYLPRLEQSSVEQQEWMARHAAARKVVMSGDTVDLTEAQYEIDDVEAYYYTSGGKTYYSFSIWNYTAESPELRMEVLASSKTHIQGKHTVDLAYSWINFKDEHDNDNKSTFSWAFFWLKYTGVDGLGDPLYDIVAIANASDGKVYTYRANMPIYAYDKDNNDDFIDLEDVVDPSVIEPKDDEIPTGIETIFNEGSVIKGDKIMLGGQLFILRGEKVYTVTGQEVK
jgi:hypothetical protein